MTARISRFTRATVYLLREGVTAIAQNVSLAVLSFVLAMALWLFVTDRENPTEAQTFNSALQVTVVNVPNGLAVAQTSQSSVRIRIEGPKNDLEDLRNEDFEATIDLGGFVAGTHSVPVEVSSPNSRIKVTSITPSTVDATLETLRTKEVPVRVSLVGSPQSGFEAVNPRAQPERVTVSGAESLVERVDGAIAEVSLTGVRVDIQSERVQLAPRDALGGEIGRVSVNPGSAQVSVDIEQREFSADYVITPDITGQPAAGYNITSITIEPRLITVTAPLEVLGSIDAVRGIATEEISVADARDDVVRTVSVLLPDGARVVGSLEVRVSIAIDPAKGELAFAVVPQARNVDATLALTPPAPVIVTLSGDLPVLQSLTAQSVTAAVDAAGLGAGTYQLPVELTSPPGTTVVRVEPAQAEITLTQRPP
jgi:YbbR domain-containing protein